MTSQFFEGSPFGLTADPASGRIWAGRPRQLARLLRLARSLQHAPESSVDLMWANFGSGKTHALYYLEHLLKANEADLAFAYVEVPEQTRTFLELYHRIMLALDTRAVATALSKAAEVGTDPDLLRASQVILHGAPSEREVARSWLIGEAPSLHQLRSLTGISSRIDEDVKAVDKLTGCITAFRASGSRVVICLDEFQRLSLNNARFGQRVMQSLRTLLSQNATNLSLILAIASRAEQTAIEQLPQELRTLIGMKPAIALPTMDEAEATEFLLERMAAFRPADYGGNAEAPFGSSNLQSIVARVCQIHDGQVGPRQVIQAAGWVLNELGIEAAGQESEVRELLDELRPEI